MFNPSVLQDDVRGGSGELGNGQGASECARMIALDNDLVFCVGFEGRPIGTYDE